MSGEPVCDEENEKWIVSLLWLQSLTIFNYSCMLFIVYLQIEPKKFYLLGEFTTGFVYKQ